jgi:hypothetical protein
MDMAFTFGVSKEGGVEFSIDGGEKPPKIVAGEPRLTSRTLLIVGGLAAAAVVLIILLK